MGFPGVPASLSFAIRGTVSASPYGLVLTTTAQPQGVADSGFALPCRSRALRSTALAGRFCGGNRGKCDEQLGWAAVEWIFSFAWVVEMGVRLHVYKLRQPQGLEQGVVGRTYSCRGCGSSGVVDYSHRLF